MSGLGEKRAIIHGAMQQSEADSKLTMGTTYQNLDTDQPTTLQTRRLWRRVLTSLLGPIVNTSDEDLAKIIANITAMT